MNLGFRKFRLGGMILRVGQILVVFGFEIVWVFLILGQARTNSVPFKSQNPGKRDMFPSNPFVQGFVILLRVSNPLSEMLQQVLLSQLRTM